MQLYQVCSGQTTEGDMQLTSGLWLHQLNYIATQSPNGVESVAFNRAGDRLAIISSQPDFMLYIYDMQTLQLLLKQNAYSDQVYRVAFTQFSPNALLTGGRAHFKHWKMAETFTGSKLQGALAKFGRLDATDTVAFCELPSGNVLSG